MQVRRVSRAAHEARSKRGLSTARAALRVAWLLARRPEGTRADEVAELLGKSVSTAYNVLASLCDEGVAVRHPGGLYRLAPAFREVVAAGAASEPSQRDFSGLADDLLARTHKRAYVGVIHEGHLRVVAERGQRGMPKLPGLAPDLGGSAHALAMGKVVLALARPEVVERYVRRRAHGLHAAHDHRPGAAARRARRGPPRGRRLGLRGVRPRLLLPGRADRRRARPFRRRRGHLDVAPGVRGGASRTRGDAARRGLVRGARRARRGAVPAICGSARAS